MKKSLSIVIVVITAILIIVFFGNILFGQKAIKDAVVKGDPQILVLPEKILQGDPVMIRVENLSSTTTVKEISFNKKTVKFFDYKGESSALVSTALDARTGIYEVSAKLSNGNTLVKKINIYERYKPQAPLGIPDKLGGNSTTSQDNLVGNLTNENALIKSLPTAPNVFWKDSFIFPVSKPVVTDVFGYTRLTGNYTISHLGTDFAAQEGTPVVAMNKGVVSFAGDTIIYGKMIVIDHGLGVQTLYLHLSKIEKTKGMAVEREEEIGLSGATGYAIEPHLHISVKINKISVDPIKFLSLFK